MGRWRKSQKRILKSDSIRKPVEKIKKSIRIANSKCKGKRLPSLNNDNMSQILQESEMQTDIPEAEKSSIIVLDQKNNTASNLSSTLMVKVDVHQVPRNASLNQTSGSISTTQVQQKRNSNHSLPETNNNFLYAPENQIAIVDSNCQDLDSTNLDQEENEVSVLEQVNVVSLAQSKASLENQPIYIVSQEPDQTDLKKTCDTYFFEDLAIPIVIQAAPQLDLSQENSVNFVLDQAYDNTSVLQEDTISTLDNNSESILNFNNDTVEMAPPFDNSDTLSLGENSLSILNTDFKTSGNKVSRPIELFNSLSLSQSQFECTLQFEQSRCSHIFSGISSDISGIAKEQDRGNVVETQLENEENSKTRHSVLNNSRDSTKSIISVTIDTDYLPVQTSSANTTAESAEQNLNKEGRPRRGRKRQHSQQNRAEKKVKLNKGKEYINYKGETVAEKTFAIGFNCKCKKKCTDVIPESQRKTVFENYWAAGSYEARCALLQGSCKEVEKIRRMSKKRTFTRKYYLNDVAVCKVAFLKTLGISQTPLDIALSKLRKHKPLTDSRGCAGGRNKISQEKFQEIKDFIKSLPKYKSHYCREKSPGKYLAPNLNLALVYDLYKERYPDGVSKSCFKNIFYTKFNLRFKKPQKDTCNRCDVFNVKKRNLGGRELEQIENEHKTHLDNARSLRQQMKEDMLKATQDDTVETLTFDLEKTNCLPRLPTNLIYYKRQLNLYNFGIHQASNNQGYFNIWLEHEGGRGTQEVGCCLKKFIFTNLRDTTKELILWADSCGGQNKSIKLVLMLMYILLNHQTLEKIIMRFLQPGHTFLPNDSEFGDLECALKTHNRLYTDDDYISIMQKCRRKNKFIVTKFTKSDFQSVEPLLKNITNRKKDINKEKVSWQKTFEIEIRKNEPNKLYFKSDITTDSIQIVDITKNSKGSQTSLKDIDLPPLYPDGRPLSLAKIKDLKDMLGLVPKDAKPFYNFLKTTSSSDFEDDIDGYGETLDFEVDRNDE